MSTAFPQLKLIFQMWQWHRQVCPGHVPCRACLGTHRACLDQGNLYCPAGELHLSGNKPAQFCASKQALEAKLLLPFSTIRIRLWQTLLAPRMAHDGSSRKRAQTETLLKWKQFPSAQWF